MESVRVKNQAAAEKLVGAGAARREAELAREDESGHPARLAAAAGRLGRSRNPPPQPPTTVKSGHVMAPVELMGGWLVAVVAEVERVQPQPLASCRDEMVARLAGRAHARRDGQDHRPAGEVRGHPHAARRRGRGRASTRAGSGRTAMPASNRDLPAAPRPLRAPRWPLRLGCCCWRRPRLASGPFKVKSCLECHDQQKSEVKRSHAHAPFKAADCEACHLRHGVIGKLVLKSAGNELCTPCHDGVAAALERKVVHAPLKNGLRHLPRSARFRQAGAPAGGRRAGLRHAATPTWRSIASTSTRRSRMRAAAPATIPTAPTSRRC